MEEHSQIGHGFLQWLLLKVTCPFSPLSMVNICRFPPPAPRHCTAETSVCHRKGQGDFAMGSRRWSVGYLLQAHQDPMTHLSTQSSKSTLLILLHPQHCPLTPLLTCTHDPVLSPSLGSLGCPSLSRPCDNQNIACFVASFTLSKNSSESLASREFLRRWNTGVGSWGTRRSFTDKPGRKDDPSICWVKGPRRYAQRQECLGKYR